MLYRPARKDDDVDGTVSELQYASGREIYDYLYGTKEHSALDFIRF